jgi:hypothetical protein
MRCHTIICLAFATLLCVFFPLMAFASQTNGTIDPAHAYAWGDTIGWVNFGTTGGDVHITDRALTGYAWSSNFGWIDLSPTHAGVTNDGNGTLGGYAWSSNFGWINFSGVTIDSSGRFGGTATTTGEGTINFNCSECVVTTDWLPAAVRNASSSGGSPSGGGVISGGGGGGGGSTASTIPRVSSSSIPRSANCSVADLNCDGRVNLIDLSILLSHYGQSVAANSPYDLDHSGTVDFPDISILMYYWTG